MSYLNTNMPRLHPLFKHSPAIIAMIHVPALPGTPANKYSPGKIIMDCLAEAELYQRMGVDGIMIENMHDRPYLNREVGHEISTLMAIIGREVKSFSEIPCGMQILAGANKAALAAAYAAEMDFIRAEGFVFGHMADEGMMQSDAAELLRYRKMIGADHIQIFTDIKKKHSSHEITKDVDLIETAKAATFFQSDGLIITGNATGEEANIMDVATLTQELDVPIIVGSGISIGNVEAFAPHCDAMIVGSYFKQDGKWENPPDLLRIKTFMNKVERIRSASPQITVR